MASLSLRHIYKIYTGNVKAVSDFNLEIDDKEFIVFVGPSGCGKSTTLRMVAGLEEITDGELYIDGKLVNDVEPKDRDIAMVFQNYALYPHMSVYDNMAFGLKLRKYPHDQIKARVNEAAEILDIKHLLTRKPKALSGGQRQRVALGRAIVREPKVFLLDEPLSNLDAKLRVQMRTEITKLHNRLATTFIYVTHDQTEAMTMGTRIVVMKDGFIQQVDTPQSLYDNPVNLFVASFIGTPQMNFIKAVIEKKGKNLFAKFGQNEVRIPENKSKKLLDLSYVGKEVIFGVRPEDIHDEQVFINANPDSAVTAEVDVIENLGNETILYMKVDGKEDYCVARVDARCKAAAGETIKLSLDTNHIHLFDQDTELSIMGVPKYNLIPADLLMNADGSATAAFGKTKLNIPASVVFRLTDESVKNNKVILGISPDDIMEMAPEDLAACPNKLSGEVDASDKYPRYIAVYNRVAGKDTFVVAKTSLDVKHMPNEAITYGVNTENVKFFSPETRESITASRVITRNITNATINKSAETATIRFGKSTLVMGAALIDAPSGQWNGYIKIDPKGVSISKEVIVANPKMVIRGVVQDIDKFSGEVVAYVTVEGFLNYFVARFPAGTEVKEGDKVKIAISKDAVSLHNPSDDEIVAAAAPAPAAKEEPAAPAAAEAKEDSVPAFTYEAGGQELKAEEPKAEEKKPAAAKKPAASSAAKTGTAAKPAAKKPASTTKKDDK